MRDVTTAGHADVIPHHMGDVGAFVECTVTPSDGKDDGLTVSASAFVEDAAPPDLVAELDPIGKNRFISFAVPSEGAGQETALRVELTALHHPDAPADAPDFSQFEGQHRYVNAFRDETTSEVVVVCPDSSAFGTTFKCATVGCDPEYLDWAALLGGDVLHVTGNAIVPSSQYNVSQLAAACAGNEGACSAASGVLSVFTGRWGDVDPGQLNVLDVAKQVDKVKELPGALPEPQCMLRPADPDPSQAATNVLDIAFAVDALKDFPYPFGIAACN